MAKIYGGRWKIVGKPTLGQGGQSEVFRVIDVRGEHHGEFALKRVKNPARHERFRTEIEATKRIQHKNIVRLIDHSALDAELTDKRQFLVMPIAEGGDLSKPERLRLYIDSVDAVLHVAKQIAGGLHAAHETGIIHRDVKPANILFTGNGHDLWVADFGICLIREEARSTDADEIVGPRSFMAPELEEGGRLDVTPAADVYALGKVIYFMISGGVIVARERIQDAQYRTVLSKSERLRLLGLLLHRMICPLELRILSMDVVLKELNELEAWEQNALLVPISATGQANLEKLQNRVLEERRIADENLAAREREGAVLANVKDAFEAWLKAELEKAAAHIARGGILTCTTGEVSIAHNQNWIAGYRDDRTYRSVGAFELRLEVAESFSPRLHCLEVHICQCVRVEIGYRAAAADPASAVQMLPTRDLQMAMIPYYRQSFVNQPQRHPRLSGFLTRQAAIGTMKGPFVEEPQSRGVSITTLVPVEPVLQSFRPDISQHTPFKASEWPGIVGDLRSALAEAIGTFVAYVMSGTNKIGP